MFRHFLGLVAGILAVPALYFGVAWSATEFQERISADNLFDPSLLNAVAVIIAVGLVAGLLAGTRVSPVTPLLTGSALLTLGLWPVINYGSMQSALTGALPNWVTSSDMLAPVGPVLPMNLVLGALLFVSALAPSRWKHRPDEPESQMGGSAPLPPLRSQPEPAVPARPIGASPMADPERTTVPFQRD